MFTMMLASLLSTALLSAHAALAVGVATPLLTFMVTDPITGGSLECDRCPPGTFMRASCTATQKTQCAQCPPGSFTELWNYIGKCLRCGVCGHNEVEKTGCTAYSNCQCQCKPGYHKVKYDMCVRHSKCPSGQQPLTKGTPDEDTVCQNCPEGSYSDTASALQNCTLHQSCDAPGLVLKGSIWHDSVCTSCEELKSRDGGDYLKEIVPAFFIHHKMTLRRLRQVVHKLPSEDGKRQPGASGLDLSELHARINTWVASASANQIRQLPEILAKSGANSAGERLKSKLQRIDSNLRQLCALGNEVDVLSF
ncbi:tumor necrosis factor receptor superfamily member 6B isoform X2 [Perca flavescens]|uniref:tumor necrosis factor receptor superfamily member 6B isoform X2 n=2 Tax=Perca flavescens TaxID=8167 RepID=UPI00106EDD32|nr:tumor necrosis factor receptor superfamily member 6B-like isoform X2 [Perca flavescens]